MGNDEPTTDFFGAPPQVGIPLKFHECDYTSFIEPIDALRTSVLNKLPPKDNGEHVVAMIIAAMADTARSIRFIIVQSEKIEENESTKLGTYFDTRTLARSVIEASLIGLLLIEAPEKYLPLYQKLGWASKMCYVHYLHLGMDDPDRKKYSEWYELNQSALKNEAELLGISKAEADAAMNRFTGAKGKKSALPMFPRTSTIASDLLKDTSLAKPAEYLWREWKFLCDDAHIGCHGLMTRALIRHPSAPTIFMDNRNDLVGRDISSRSIYVAAVAQVVLCTAMYLQEFRNDEKIAGHCIESWTQLEGGTRLGSTIWHTWAKSALGVLGE
jgi:hypothetical protein